MKRDTQAPPGGEIGPLAEDARRTGVLSPSNAGNVFQPYAPQCTSRYMPTGWRETLIKGTGQIAERVSGLLLLLSSSRDFVVRGVGIRIGPGAPRCRLSGGRWLIHSLSIVCLERQHKIARHAVRTVYVAVYFQLDRPLPAPTKMKKKTHPRNSTLSKILAKAPLASNKGTGGIRSA